MLSVNRVILVFVFYVNLTRPLILTSVFFLMIRRPPRSTLDRSSAASDVYKRQDLWKLTLDLKGGHYSALAEIQLDVISN